MPLLARCDQCLTVVSLEDATSKEWLIGDPMFPGKRLVLCASCRRAYAEELRARLLDEVKKMSPSALEVCARGLSMRIEYPHYSEGA